MQDEGGRIDLNKATTDLLSKILSQAGLSAPDVNALTGAIMARRGTGTGASGRPRAPSTKGYTAQATGFALADALDGLPGMQAGFFDRLRPLFTVANGSAGIDPVVAAPAIRAIIPSRELLSAAFEPMTTPSNHSDFTIDAAVATAAGLRYQREAVLHLDPQTGPLGRFTSWEAPVSYETQRSSGEGAFCSRVASALVRSPTD